MVHYLSANIKLCQLIEISLKIQYYEHSIQLIWTKFVENYSHTDGIRKVCSNYYKTSFSVRAMRAFKPSFDCVSI